MARFAEVLVTLRDRLQLIPDTVQRLGGLSVEQYDMVVNLIDQIQDDMSQAIINFSEGDATPNQLLEEGDEE